MATEAYCPDQKIHDDHEWVEQVPNGYVGESNTVKRWCPGIRVRPSTSMR